MRILIYERCLSQPETNCHLKSRQLNLVKVALREVNGFDPLLYASAPPTRRWVGTATPQKASMTHSKDTCTSFVNLIYNGRPPWHTSQEPFAETLNNAWNTSKINNDKSPRLPHSLILRVPGFFQGKKKEFLCPSHTNFQVALCDESSAKANQEDVNLESAFLKRILTNPIENQRWPSDLN